MKVAIIAEYNPFHYGHAYQLAEAKKRFPNHKILIVLSGKYVQRGEIAVASFESRKEMALQYGADEVVELPFEYSTQAAHIFAEGAVLLAAKHGATKLFFGSESNNANLLVKRAKITINQKTEYDQLVKKNLKTGLSFPKASANALSVLSGESIELAPNDTLGLEYCKAILKNNLAIEPQTLQRTIDHNATVAKDHFASASTIRKMLANGEKISQYTPMILSTNFESIKTKYNEFQNKIISYDAQEIAKYKLVSEGIENLFKKHIHLPDYDEFVAACTSRRYTSSRIKRIILYILLEIK